MSGLAAIGEVDRRSGAAGWGKRRGRSHGHRSGGQTVPVVSKWMVAWFTRYARWYLRRHFHALRCAREGLPDSSLAGLPVVVYVNHASWWDPLVALVLKDFLFPQRRLFAPMHRPAVERYPMLQRMGFFGIEPGTVRGALGFMRASEAILADGDSVLTVTPQGRFMDCRERPPRFDPGLGALAARSPGASFLPVALEFVFWEERLPEILVRFGAPALIRAGRDVDGTARSASEWTVFFESRMTQTQDALALAARRRDPSEFTTLLRGGAGQGGVYDLWRAFRARIQGKRFQREHGNK